MKQIFRKISKKLMLNVNGFDGQAFKKQFVTSKDGMIMGLAILMIKVGFLKVLGKLKYLSK